MLDETNRNAELWNTLATNSRVPSRGSTTQTCDRCKSDGIVHAFFGKPALAIAQEFLAQNRVQGAIGFGYWIVPNFVFRLNRSRREAGKNRARGLHRRLNASSI